MMRILFQILFCLSVSLCLQGQSFNGYPSREGKIDIRTNFATPPKGYGNVPFYWWNGDSLNRERLSEQLDLLREAAVDGFSVSYIHSHPSVDVELNKNGYGSFGKADPGAPGIFTDAWWDLWNWFSGKCADAGLGVGLDDYVVGWAGNGYYIDELCKDKGFSGYQGKLSSEAYAVKPAANLDLKLSKKPLCIMAYPDGIDLTGAVEGDRLLWKSGSKTEQKIYVIYTRPSYELHPEYGKRLVNAYFDRFEQHLDEKGREGMNYFFQDELHYSLTLHSWSEDMPAEFKARKGYDVVPYLPALFDTIGAVTPKIRLDYAEVVTQLSEERYFKPVFDWHEKRGLIYGCDNNGRGLAPLEYLDYFRVTSWFTAPGNDAPARGSSFRQTKVSSSVAHLYERPRTWLEAFHSMGWDSNGEWLTSQLDHHLIAGGNLLCLHGLYYSTHGGWWEWAPPCFHFRMPYWPHMKQWLKYAERLSFLLSQGTHVCDVAVMYPTEAMQAYPDLKGEAVWGLTDSLSMRGLDYDFMDYQSLQKAEIRDGELSVSGERYKVLVLADMKAMHSNTLRKVLDFYRKGGIVIVTGILPEATSRKGENDPELQNILQELFHSSEGKGIGLYEADYRKIPSVISGLLVPDFSTSTGSGRVLHRRIGERDVYMVMNVEKGAEMRFRAKGKVECWNAKDGSVKVQPIMSQTEEGTRIRFEDEGTASRLFVFSPGVPVMEEGTRARRQLAETSPVEGNWEVEFVPTMDNKWGDFRLPASDELIGPEARRFTCDFVTPFEEEGSVSELSSQAWKGLYGYAPYFETRTLPVSEDWKEHLSDDGSSAVWKPYAYSWQYGVFDNPGSQGYHGLKGKIDNCFLILDQGAHQLFRTFVYAPRNASYRIEQEGVAPTYCAVDGREVTTPVVILDKGWHRLQLVYANTPKGSYNLAEKKSNSVDNRARSALVLYEENASALKETSPYDPVPGTKWYGTEHLPYSITDREDVVWRYRFETVPGTQTLHFQVKGEILQVWVDGKKVGKKALESIADGVYTLTLKKPNPGMSTVTLTARPERGYAGAAFFAEPVRLTSKGGLLPTGNWTNFGALHDYSGGIRYTKRVELAPFSKDDRIRLNLGAVDATCEVKVNGRMVDVLMNTPYALDITDDVKPGNNVIEVLVYSSLSNHYQTIPSAYRGEPRAGLIGPVQMERWNVVK